MAYEWTQLGIREITNLYLYGQPGTPADVADASRIRAPGKGIAVDVNMPSFMSTGPGRFALGSLSHLVQTFFKAGADRSWMETDRAYSMTEIVPGTIFLPEIGSIFLPNYWKNMP